MLLRHVAFLGSFLLPAISLFAEDHFLVIGGGPTPQTSQLSIEQNILYLRRALFHLQRSDLDPVVFFASGDSKVPDVCFDQSDRIPEANRLLAEIFGSPRGIQLGYRCHDVGEVRGSTARKNIVDELHRYARELRAGDRLYLYISGHGGKGEPTSNGYVETWADGDLRVRDLGEILDRFAPEVEVVTVMVQCYSGAFANLIFEGGDPSKPLSKHRRAGFFATIDSRPAAGCTPDTKVENYHEYTTSFLAALAGKDRAGNIVQATDINRDGIISFAEAHAHAVIHSPTIDVSCRTSDRLLDVQARQTPPKQSATTIPWKDLLDAADPVRKHTLAQLALEFGKSGDDLVSQAEKEAKDLVAQRRRSRAMISALEDSRDNLAHKLETNLRAHWPFLQNPWHPETHRLLADDGKNLLDFLKKDPSYSAWRRLRERIKEAKETDLARERRWAKLERLVLTAHMVATASQLPEIAPVDVQEAYARLIALENETLARTPEAFKAN